MCLAVTLAEEAAKAGAKTFVYISAVDSFFVLPKRYITTKREAEERIAEVGSSGEYKMRSVFLRPAFLYDSSRLFTIPLAGIMTVTSTVNGLFGRKLPLLGAAGWKPLAAEDVAGAVVKSLEDTEVTGVVEIDEISTLATRIWREGML
jgi:uncharacterized protein YbjT (DUF2867 family)